MLKRVWKQTFGLYSVFCLLAVSFALVLPVNADSTLMITGEFHSDGLSEFGHVVESIPDMNNDGLSEMMVCRPVDSTDGGYVYIFFSPLNGKNLTSAQADVTIVGETGNDGQMFGFSGAYLPDVFTDFNNIHGEIAIGAPGHNNDDGAIFIFELDNISVSGNYDISDAEHVILGENAEKFGHSVAMAGDIDADNNCDMLVGAPEGFSSDYIQSGNLSGRAYIIHGKEDIPATSSGSDVVIMGFENGEDFGFSVSAGGDLNDDTTDDIIIGAPQNSSSGMATVFFGGALNAQMDTGDAPCVITGTFPEAELGYSVSSTGDFNGDGIDDVILGSPGHMNDLGGAYVVFGDNSLGDIELGVTPSGYIGYLGTRLSRLGHSVSGLEDMDNDGFDDCIVGAPMENETRGFAYTFFGNASFPYTYFDTTDANTTNKGMWRNEQFGSCVSEAGNVDGDVYMDAFIGAPNAAEQKGKAYLLRLDHLPVLTVPTLVEPQRGGPGTTFTYKVIYSDIENDEPETGHPRVHIYTTLDGSGENASSPSAMVLDTSAESHLHDGDYVNGEQYYFQTCLGREEDFNYNFDTRANSGLTDLVETPFLTDEVTGPSPIVDVQEPPQASGVVVADTPGDLGGSIDVSWDEMSIEDFGAYEIYIENYSFNNVQFKVPEMEIQLNTTTSCSITTCNGETLVDYDNYYVAVGARDDVDNRLFVITSHQVTPKDNFNLLPSAISDLSARPGDNEGEVRLTWTSVGEDAMENGPVQEYIARMTTTRPFYGPSDWANGDLIDTQIPTPDPGQTMELIIQGLDIGMEYYFAVRAVDGVGQMSNLTEGARNSSSPAQAADLISPAPIEGVGVYDIEDENTSIGIHWSSSKDSDFHHYNIYISTQSFISVDEVGVFLENNSIVDRETEQSFISSINGQELVFGVTYYVGVTAVDESGNENLSVICSKGILFRNDNDVVAPEPIKMVNAVDTPEDNGGSITLSWDMSEDEDFFEYQIFISTNTITTINGIDVSLCEKIEHINVTTSVVDELGGAPLLDGTKYFFAVVAMDFNELYSDLGSTSTCGPVKPVNDSDSTPPQAITGLATSNVKKTNLTLNWVPITLGDVPDFNQYIIFYSSNGTISDKNAANRIDSHILPSLSVASTSSAFIEGLTRGTTYHFVLLCQDDRMEKEGDIMGHFSEELQITTNDDNMEPELSEGSVSPAKGFEGDHFTFSIKVVDTDSAPDFVKVVIDGNTYTMERTGEWLNSMAYYTYTKTLSLGEHTFYFTVLDDYYGNMGYTTMEQLEYLVEYHPENNTVVVEEKIVEKISKEIGVGTIVIIVIILALVLAGGIGLVLMMKKKRAETEKKEREVSEENELPSWECSCGETISRLTQSAHCGYCGDSHEALTLEQAKELVKSRADQAEVSNAAAKELYAQMYGQGTPEEEKEEETLPSTFEGEQEPVPGDKWPVDPANEEEMTLSGLPKPPAP